MEDTFQTFNEKMIADIKKEKIRIQNYSNASLLSYLQGARATINCMVYSDDDMLFSFFKPVLDFIEEQIREDLNIYS